MTSDGEALFRAVCENPADDTPRLVYADWLDENGRPERAEFIRLQCEAWHLCPDYPTVTAARNRASKLLRVHGDRWYAELPHSRGVVWSALFVRGFVDTARLLTGRDVVGQVAPLFDATPLRHLAIDSLDPGQLEVLLAVPQLGRLTTLRLPNVQYDAAGLRCLSEARRRLSQTTILPQVPRG